MSYILDALKKSSEERRKHETDRQTTFPTVEEAVPRRNTRRTGTTVITLLMLVIVTAAVAAGGWIFFTFHTPSEKKLDIPDTVVQVESVNPPETAPRQQTSVALEPKTEQTSVASLPRSSQSISPQPAKTPTPKRTPPAPGPAKETIPLLEDLPFEVQATIPEMKFSGHVYSPTPSLRMIMINTGIVREKEMVAKDLRLLEITENGLLMEFKGTRFRVKLF